MQNKYDYEMAFEFIVELMEFEFIIGMTMNDLTYNDNATYYDFTNIKIKVLDE